MKRPTDQQFETACLWLEANEGNNGEKEACQAVADYLDSLMVKKTMNLMGAMLKKGFTREQIIKIASKEKS